MNKKLIAGTFAALVFVAIGWGLARHFAREDAIRAEKARGFIEAHAARVAEANRAALANIREGAAREALEEKSMRDRAAAEKAKHREIVAAAAALSERPEYLGQEYLHEGEWAKLDALVESLTASGKRAPNGRFEMDKLIWGVESYFGNVKESEDRAVSERLAQYRRQFPKSAFAPILPAMRSAGAAWRARGRGYSSTVTAEGGELFAERTQAAWQEIMAVRSVSDRLPVSYEQAIKTGIDANIGDDELMGLVEEGIKRFPGNHGIYFATLRGLSPRYGGSYPAAEKFIRKHVAAGTNTEGETLYTRLYWQLDAFNGSDAGFFEDSGVDWPRMRSGLETLLGKYPDPQNRAVFAAFACRAGDAPAYLKLRDAIDTSDFEEYAPAGLSLEVCNSRFLRKS